MAKPLSQQLADLSARAKNAEDAVAAAKQEAHDKIVARREQTRAATTAAFEKIDRDIKSIEDTTSQHWGALKAKVATDMNFMKANIAEFQHERDVKRAENHAHRLDREATFAIDYAVASIEQAKLAVLDAVIGHGEAEKAKNS